jgi:hypothetical protein
VKHAGCFAAVIAFATVLASPAWARIGVTSVTDGTTSVAQGSDLQAGQRIITGADGRVHLMFLDGTAVTVGPNSVLQIGNFAYDPTTKTGAMTLDVQQGTVRFVGGAISKKADVQIRTPSSTIALRGGIAAVSVSESGATTADFLHGNAMRVSSQGVTETATRSGSQINVAAGAAPTRPALLAPGQLASVQSLDRPAAGRRGPSVDEAAARSELGKHNSGLALQPAIAANTPATVPLKSTQQVQVVQTSQQLAISPAAAQLVAPAVAMPAPAAPPVQTTPVALPTPVTPTPAPPAAPPKTGGGTQVAGSGTITLSGSSGFGGSGTITKSGAGTIILIGTTPKFGPPGSIVGTGK